MQAAFGLGSNLNKIQATEPALAKRARAALVGQLEHATSAGELAVALTALGNAGDVTTINSIKRFVEHPSPGVRESAAQSLRRIPGAEANRLLIALTADPVWRVRLSAVDAIGERASHGLLVEAIQRLAVFEKELVARGKAIALLTNWVRSVQGIAITLAAIAENEPDPKLKRLASEAIGG